MLFSLTTVAPSFSQSNAHYLYAVVPQVSDRPILDSTDAGGGPVTGNSELNALFQQHGVYNYEQAFPGAYTPSVAMTYRIELTGSVDGLMMDLEALGAFPEIIKMDYGEPVAGCPNPIYVNDIHQDYSLASIDARCAWNITKGDTNMVVAICDTEMDTTHEDIANKIVYKDPGICGIKLSDPKGGHGTAVAAFAAADTDNGLGVAAVGHDLRIAGYCASQIWKAGVTHGRRVVNLSFADNNLSPAATREFTARGSVLVLSAGNNPNDHGHDHNGNVPGVIVVSSVNNNDSIGPTNHARNGYVDLCAPGTGLTYLIAQSGNGYGGGGAGTSFAAPIVAGAVGLLLSEYPCLSPAMVERILKESADHIADSAAYPGKTGAGKLNIYRALQIAPNYMPHTALAITGHVFWDRYEEVDGILTVDSGGKLTVTGKVGMTPGSKVIVKPGGRLIIDGGQFNPAYDCTPDTAAGRLWEGIEVWGISALNQNIIGANSGFTYHQGYLELRNKALISGARNAVVLQKPGDPTARGGKIYSIDGSFVNNERSVVFEKYDSLNRSTFIRTDFVIDNDYYGGTFKEHVSLWGVHGVVFSACTLENFTTKLDLPNTRRGIYSLDASYSVHGFCEGINPVDQPCPASDLKQPFFRHMRTAIEARTSGSALGTVKVDQAYFENSRTGILINGIQQAVLTRNEGWHGYYFGGVHHGIHLQNTSGYRVEENHFRHYGPGNGTAYGIRVEDSQGADNQIYHNTMVEQDFGISAEGVNRSGSAPYHGMQLLCNTFNEVGQSLKKDIYIVETFPIPNSDDGIRSIQGDAVGSISAGNVFSHPTVEPEGDISNGAPNVQQYYYRPGAEEPLHFTPLFVDTMLAAQSPGCPSRVFEGVLPTEMAQDMADGFRTAEGAFANLTYTHAQAVDGGNTTALLQDIQAAWPEDAYDLRDQLLAESPYLSQEAIRAAAEQDVLPPAMLLQVCLANPEATRDEDFIRFLGEEINTPLPPYMLDLIVANWGQETPRGVLEGALAHHGAIMGYNGDVLLHHLKMDTADHLPEIRVWLTRRGTLTDCYSLAETWLAEGNHAQALSEAQGIPSDLSLSERQQSEHVVYLDYLQWRKDVGLAGHEILSVDAEELAELTAIAELESGRGSALARNILCFGYGQCAEEEPYEGDGLGKRLTRGASYLRDMDRGLEGPQPLRAFPSPADREVSLVWQLEEKVHAGLVVRDLKGNTVAERTISTVSGQWLLETSTMPSGTYTAQLIGAEGNLGIVKFVISH